VSVCGGKSASVALTGRLNGTHSLMVWSLMGGMTGRTLTTLMAALVAV
jgi:hypothetical protein